MRRRTDGIGNILIDTLGDAGSKTLFKTASKVPRT